MVYNSGMMTYTEIIDKYYPPDTLRRAVYLHHCGQVAELAVDIARELDLPVEISAVKEAAMLHDIGICLTDAPEIGCTGKSPYIMHGVLGAELLRKEGFDEVFARVAERHTGAGITAQDVDSQGLPLPKADYMPRTLIERLVCYADKFYSKSGTMERKPLDKVIRSMERISPSTLERFMKLHEEFGEGLPPEDAS